MWQDDTHENDNLKYAWADRMAHVPTYDNLPHSKTDGNSENLWIGNNMAHVRAYDNIGTRMDRW